MSGRAGTSSSSSGGQNSKAADLYEQAKESWPVRRTVRIGGNLGRVTKKVLLHTGKAAWILGTVVLVVVVPLIIEMDREQQLVDLESQQMQALGVQPGGTAIR
eukprot:jgi/Chlat1/2687/Chrsp180S02859